MGKQISATAARAVLAEIQTLADECGPLANHPARLALVILASLTGRLQTRLPRSEWGQIDLFRKLGKS